jgi:periplasmic protein TonB
MFEQSLVTTHGGARKPAAFVASSIGQVLLIGLLIVAPLLSTSELPQVWLTGILQAPAVPPGPPPPPPVRPQSVAPAQPRQFTAEFTQPREIPEEIEIIIDEPAPALSPRANVIGGIGSGDGARDGVIDSILGQTRRAAAPPPPPPPPEPKAEPEPEETQRVRVGGEVRAPVLIRRVAPKYPPLARPTRVEGVVRLACIIGVDGRLNSITTVSGHPLLVPAAVEAVRQWRYQPTLLNGNPVEVVMQVSVNFKLR